jgi:VWFA-related protein
MLRGAACLVVGLLLCDLPAGAADRGDPPASQEKPPEQTFKGEIDVSLVTMVIRVVDTWGRPILGLKPQDFRVRVGKSEVPVVAIDWVSAGNKADVPGVGAGFVPVREEASRSPASGSTEQPAAEPMPEPGRLVVIFVQADLNPTRISGQLRLRRYTRELLGTLHPEDRVAVVSFDSHLKLWQDFARDHDATHAAIDQAMLYSEAPERAPGGTDSIARHFDFAAARKAASPERALELTARALEPLPGEKTVIFLGWGLGRYGANGVRMTPDYKPAVKALGAARASVFVLDVTSADYHSLEVGLEGVAEATGGLYFKTFRLPELATDTLARAISGYYVLTLDGGAVADEEGKVRIELREKSGTVLARSVALR